ncbi:ATPase [Vibrio sp.]|uniref:Dph6-related ATP pyrophosphatase n=1 Tax=Vibrio sp. TaxID=678 RepID=UPI003D151FDC
MKRKVMISWSSGKDSALVLERLNADPDYQVVGLFTTYVADEVPFQVTPIDVVEMQADLIGLPLVKIVLPEVFPSNPVYQQRVVEGLRRSNLDFSLVAFGDMFHNGIAQYRRSYIEPAGWQCLFPLMGEDSMALAEEIIQRGIEAVVVTCDGESRLAENCGQQYNLPWVAALPAGVDPCGENGEFHTLVLSAPSFSGQLALSNCLLERGPRFSHLRYDATVIAK